MSTASLTYFQPAHASPTVTFLKRKFCRRAGCLQCTLTLCKRSYGLVVKWPLACVLHRRRFNPSEASPFFPTFSHVFFISMLCIAIRFPTHPLHVLAFTISGAPPVQHPSLRSLSFGTVQIKHFPSLEYSVFLWATTWGQCIFNVPFRLALRHSL